MRKAHFVLLLFLFCIGNFAFSQPKNNILDSLEKALIKNQKLRDLAQKRDYIKIDTTRVNTLNFLATELIFRTDFERAKLFINEALDIANKIDFKRGLVNIYNNLGTLYRRQSNYPLALQNLEKALKIGNAIGYKEALANTYNNRANVYYNKSNYPEALKNNLAALKIREELKDRKGVAISYNNLGAVNKKIGNYNDALKYYTISLKINTELNDRRGLLNSYLNFGNIYFEAGNKPEALINYFEVLKISQELGDKLTLANVNLNIGETYCTLNDFDKSIDYNIKALNINRTMRNNFGVTRCYINAANTYMALNQFRFSRVYLDSAIQLSKEIGAKQLTRDSYQLLSEVDSLENDWKNAYNHYKTYTHYNDSITNKDNSEKMRQTQIQYELEKKDLAYQKLIALKAIQFEYKQKQATVNNEKEKQRLRYEQQIKQQKINFEYEKKIAKVEAEQKHQLALNEILAKENNLMTQNSINEAIIRWLMILALFGFVAFGLNYYKNFKRQKTANIIIAKQGEDLKTLIHELNHRVKNNFQTVASMLNMQTRFLEDKTLIDVLMQTSNRFLAISSVHEKLYQLEGFSNIPIKDYLYDIVGNISHQFGVAKEQFEYKIEDTCELKTNIQTVLPIVLIVNELATNTFKHAYNANRKLCINILISHVQENRYQLIYKDNGPGLPDNFSQSTKFGQKLLKLFAEQLHGNINFSNEDGAVCNLTFEYD